MDFIGGRTLSKLQIKPNQLSYVCELVLDTKGIPLWAGGGGMNFQTEESVYIGLFRTITLIKFNCSVNLEWNCK